MDILDGVETVGLWPGQSREYRRDDWEVGFRDRRGEHHKLVRVRNADRDNAYAYYLWLPTAITTIGPFMSSATTGLIGATRLMRIINGYAIAITAIGPLISSAATGLLGKIVDWFTKSSMTVTG